MDDAVNEGEMLALLPEEAGRMRLGATPQPTLREGEVLLEVMAAGINRADLSQLAGHYPPPAGESEILGLEAAGRVVALGPGLAPADEELIGKPFMALLPGGGYAQRVAVPRELLMGVTEGWSFAEAAAFPETAFTAYVNLFNEAGLQAGERVLIHGGASGVGTAATVQAKLAGATVIATAGGPKKVATTLQMGADIGIDRHEESFREVITEKLGRIDVILDMVGGDYFEDNLALLRAGGRLVVISTLGGRHAQIDLSRLMMKRARVIGSTLRARPVAEKARLRSDLESRFGTELASGELKPLVDTVYSWERVNEAHDRMRANDTVGKLVLTVS